MRTSRYALLLLIPLAAGARSIGAHSVEHEVTRGPATVVRLTYADGTPFAFESYEVHCGDEPLPAQVGRTDHDGRIVFLADRPATWRIRAFSEDGHGVDLTIEAGGAPAVDSPARPTGFPRATAVITGVGIILGIFGLLSMFYRMARKESKS